MHILHALNADIIISVGVPVFNGVQIQNSGSFQDTEHFLSFLPFPFTVAWKGELPCRKWDCECAFKRQRGCCCAANELQEVEDQIFMRIMDLLAGMSQLGEDVLEIIGILEHRHYYPPQVKSSQEATFAYS